MAFHPVESQVEALARVGLLRGVRRGENVLVGRGQHVGWGDMVGRGGRFVKSEKKEGVGGYRLGIV